MSKPKLPSGFAAGDIEWPAPKALPVGPLVNYGYERDVLHLVTVTPPRDLEVGRNVALRARADTLATYDGVLLGNGPADLVLTLPVEMNAATDPRSSGAISLTRAALPQPLALSRWTAEARANGSMIELKLAPPDGAPDPGALRFFALQEARIEPSAPQTLSRDRAGAYVLTLPVASRLAPDFTRLRIVTASVFGCARSLRFASRATHPRSLRT